MSFRRRLFLLSLVLLVPVAVQAAPTLVRTLPNKVTLITREVRTRPIVCLEAWVRAGGRDESEGTRGASSILAHRLFETTQKYPEGELAKQIAAVGGTLSSESGYGYSLYTITVPGRYMDRAVDCLSEALLRPVIDDTFLRRGGAAARDAARGALSSATGVSLNTVRATLWAGTPLAAPFVTPETEIVKTKLPELKRFWTEHYVAENLTLVATGDVDSEALAEQVARAFADMPHGRADNPRPLSPKPFEGPKVIATSNTRDTPGAAIMIGFRGPAGGSADALAVQALLALLVDSPSSRFQRRLDQGATEYTAAEAARGFEAEGGVFTVALDVPPARLLGAEEVLLGEIQKVKSTPIAADEFDAAIRTVVAQDLFPQGDLEGLGRATAIAQFQGKVGSDEVYFERLRALRPEDLTAVARKYMDFKRCVFVEFGPDSLLDTGGASRDQATRIREKQSMAEASYKSGPAVAASSDSDRRSRVDAPLARIPARPVESGRGFVQQQKLAGGLRLITAEDWSVPIATVSVYMLGGVRYETEANNGVTVLAREVLLNSQNPARPGSTFRQTLTRLGRLFPYQDRDMWGYSVSVPSESVEEAMRTLGDMLRHQTVDTLTVDASRVAVLSAYDGWESDDATQRRRLIFPTKYRTSGYRLPSMGNRHNLATIPEGEIDNLYRKFLVRPNVVVAVFGAARAESARAWSERAFREIPDREFNPGPVPKEPELADEREQWELGGGPGCTVTLAFNGPPATSLEMPALFVVNSLLSGPRGWFNQWLLTEKDIVSGANSIVSQAIDESPIIATIEVTNITQEEEGVKLLLRQFKKVALLPLVGKELGADLENAKAHALGSYLMVFDSNTGRAFQWARADLFRLPPDYVLSLPSKIEAIGPDDIVSVGLRYFQKDDWNRRPVAICETRPGGW